MPFQAEARIVCRVFGTDQDVTVKGRKAPIEAHPAFNSMSISQRLFNVPPAAVDAIPDNDKTVCLAKATDYVKNELPGAYTLDGVSAAPIFGHAFIDGRWIPTAAGQVSYAFPLLRNGEPIEDETLSTEPGGKAQSLTLSWWVVVQPKAS